MDGWFSLSILFFNNSCLAKFSADFPPHIFPLSWYAWTYVERDFVINSTRILARMPRDLGLMTHHHQRFFMSEASHLRQQRQNLANSVFLLVGLCQSWCSLGKGRHSYKWKMLPKLLLWFSIMHLFMLIYEEVWYSFNLAIEQRLQPTHIALRYIWSLPKLLSLFLSLSFRKSKTEFFLFLFRTWCIRSQLMYYNACSKNMELF